MAVAIISKNYHFRIMIQNLNKCNIFSTFGLKNCRKFTDYNLGKLCPQSLASTVSVLGLEKVCPRKVSPWPRIFFFFESLASNVVSSTPPLVKSNTVLSTARHRCNISSKGAALPGRNDAEIGPTNSLHASA